MQNLNLGKQQSTQLSKNGVSSPLMTKKPTQDKSATQTQKPDKEKQKGK